MIKKLLRQGRIFSEVRLRHLMRLRQSGEDLASQANDFWNDASNPQRSSMAHCRGHGPFQDDAVWWKLGRDHWDLYQRELAKHGRTPNLRRVVEWGVGGGMNAVHFGRSSDAYIGVDISQDILNECRKQCQREGVSRFIPVLMHPHHPEPKGPMLEAHCDLFLSTYVFELLPTEEHGYEILKIAASILAPRGHALIQIRYDDGTPGGRSRPWNYAQNIAHNVSYPLNTFRQNCEKAGLQVLSVIEVPYIPELQEHCYAYFLLEKLE